MAHDDSDAMLQGQKKAFIRDGALILYFDTAEIPFVGRYDLESLAQANFEVSEKREGFYYLTLRDFSGQTQNIGQFGSKTDAHHALYAILQALLSQQEKQGGNRRIQGSRGKIISFLLNVLKTIAAILVAVLILVVVLRLVSTRNVGTPPIASVGPNMTTPSPGAAPRAPLDLPEGEAVDADSILPPSFSEPDPSAGK